MGRSGLDKVWKILRSSRARFALIHGVILMVLLIYINSLPAKADAIRLTENFEPGAAQAFEHALTPLIDTVILDVSGGYLTEGLEIGRIIRARQMRVIVPAGATCLSACAEAFLGGVQMQIDGTLAFHIPRVVRSSSRNQAFSQGLTGGTLTAIYRYEMGFGFDLTRSINRWTTSNRLLAFESTAELMRYKGPGSGAQLPRFYQY
ncbi:MAG: hypothetical protein JKY31_12805 [Rhodobacteraceae bacterium]|nr:hypothetical protein [Paracoccaceae bacterium]